MTAWQTGIKGSLLLVGEGWGESGSGMFGPTRALTTERHDNETRKSQNDEANKWLTGSCERRSCAMRFRLDADRRRNCVSQKLRRALKDYIWLSVLPPPPTPLRPVVLYMGAAGREGPSLRRKGLTFIWPPPLFILPGDFVLIYVYIYKRPSTQRRRRVQTRGPLARVIP